MNMEIADTQTDIWITVTSLISRDSHSLIVTAVVVCFEITVTVPSKIPDSSTNYIRVDKFKYTSSTMKIWC